MSAIYFAIPTNAGQARIANAIALGIPLKITHMAIGDGNGQPVTPNPAQTALAREVRRAPLNTLFQDPLNPAQLVAEQIIPEDTGGWWVREVGLYDDSGTLIAVANTPETYKPLLTSGAGRTQTIRMVLIVSDTSAVELKIDPSVVLATRKYVDDTMKAHKESRNHPDASETEKGFSRHATQEEVNEPKSNDLEHPVVTVEKLWSWAEQAGGKVPHVFALWKRSMAAAGYDLIGRFGTSNTIATANQVLMSKDGTKVYAWTGGLPKDIYPDTNPLGGGFVDISSELLFDISYSASVEAKNATTDFNIIIGDKPLPFTASKRDAYQVSRYLDGKTDCHAFADKTEIREISDSGTYGTFDSQTVITHDGVQNHQFSFQDRARYEGGGTLSSWGNIIWPEMIGSGHVTQRTDIEIKDVGGAGGSIASHIGLYIRDLSRATSNVAINLAQSSGFSLYAPYAGAKLVHVGNVTFGGVSTDASIKLKIAADSAVSTVALNINKTNGYAIFSPENGKNYLNGNVGIGVLPSGNTPLLVGKPGFTSQFFVDNDTSSVYTGAVGDYQYNLVSGGANRMSILPSSNGYAVAPGGNGTQRLGTATNRWSEIFAANATINTSDAREKQQVYTLSDAERRVAARIKDLFVTFKFNRAVEQKGDGARIHVGVIAQDVQAAFIAEGLDPHRYSLFCFDEWAESSEEVETTEDDPDAYSKAVEVQKTETVTVAKRRIEIHGDTAVQIEYTEQVEQPMHAIFPVFDEVGRPIMHMISPYDELTGADAVYRQETIEVPVMETQTRYYKRVTTPAAELYGIRYEELLAFVIAAL
ncbi:hypothetical protein KAM339_020640 [Aeromonas caviae]|uniref:phage tail-collar fiber domain-containing protein n=1 Tax=Aeromonas caviae TaxID=648 RepID=UPI001CC4633C|nr:phage tail protein [Aeromonas caviae]BDA12067.1 hypothetical protein KAM339_006080 [Aeromonas caviae]BDA13523.1 hypothetical protein KAM339_020640 [Aeromonas caviae]